MVPSQATESKTILGVIPKVEFGCLVMVESQADEIGLMLSSWSEIEGEQCRVESDHELECPSPGRSLH